MPQDQEASLEKIRTHWKHPTDILFGVNRVRELPTVCWQLGITAPLLVTDSGVANLPFIRDIRQYNRQDSIETSIFSEITAEPSISVIRKGAERLRKGGFDGIIAVGGGSSLDAGKAISLAAAVGPRRIWEYAAEKQHPPAAAKRICPVIAIPTTAGTGSEVDANAVITDETGTRKVSITHPELLPKTVIADPELTKGLIPYLTASTGMDALSHNLEALCSPVFQPILDAIALQGIRFVKEWLPVAFHEGHNLHSRVYTMASSIMGAMAFEKGLGAMHALAHSVGGLFKTHHGRTVGALMPHVLLANRDEIRNKMAQVARNLDLPHHDFDAVVHWIVELRLELGLPTSLSELGVREDAIPAVVENALQDVNLATNPVPLSRSNLETIVAQALHNEPV
jgi:hypothetical protein